LGKFKENVNHDVRDLERKKKGQEARLKELDRKVPKAEDTYFSLEHKINSSENKLKNLKDEIKKLEKDKSKIENEKYSIRKERQRLDSDKERFLREKRDFERELKKAKEIPKYKIKSKTPSKGRQKV